MMHGQKTIKLDNVKLRNKSVEKIAQYRQNYLCEPRCFDETRLLVYSIAFPHPLTIH
jgi:hypothetical protein